MNSLIICIGTSGAGKSTWCSTFLKENLNFLRINRDSLRLNLVQSLGGYYQRKDLHKIEDSINYIERDIFTELSLCKRDIIIDNTNLRQSYINHWIGLAKNSNYDFKFKLFDIELDVAKDRVYHRDFDLPGSVFYMEPPNNSDLKKVEYIEKQYKDYIEIKKFIENNYKEKII